MTWTTLSVSLRIIRCHTSRERSAWELVSRDDSAWRMDTKLFIHLGGSGYVLNFSIRYPKALSEASFCQKCRGLIAFYLFICFLTTDGSDLGPSDVGEGGGW